MGLNTTFQVVSILKVMALQQTRDLFLSRGGHCVLRFLCPGSTMIVKFSGASLIHENFAQQIVVSVYIHSAEPSLELEATP